MKIKKNNKICIKFFSAELVDEFSTDLWESVVDELILSNVVVVDVTVVVDLPFKYSKYFPSDIIKILNPP